jgi:Pentapeptide repeats (9 copies)
MGANTAMTYVDLEDRLREEFGTFYPRPHWLPDTKLAGLVSHQVWCRTAGRFGTPINWKNLRYPFKAAVLCGDDFSQVVLNNCHFEWSDLRCTRFVGAVLKDVTFENCDLEDADFSDARLENVTFTDCLDLDKARFEGTVFIPENGSPALAPAAASTAPINATP